MRTLRVLVLALSATPTFAAGLPRSSPEAQGVSSSAVLAFLQAADKDLDSLHSFMLVRHGHVAATWFGDDDLTKTLAGVVRHVGGTPLVVPL